MKRHPVMFGLLLAAGIVLVAFVAMVLGLFGSIPATPVSKVKAVSSAPTHPSPAPVASKAAGLVCNYKGHYISGMYAKLTVT